MIGRVVSTKMSKTAVVLVEGKKTHPLYRKTFVQSKKYLVDSQPEVKMGDIVEIEKTRPLSKRKHWQVKKILGQDIIALGEAVLKEEAKVAIAEVLPREVQKNSVDQTVSLPACLSADMAGKAGESENSEITEKKESKSKSTKKGGK